MSKTNNTGFEEQAKLLSAPKAACPSEVTGDLSLEGHTEMTVQNGGEGRRA